MEHSYLNHWWSVGRESEIMNTIYCIKGPAVWGCTVFHLQQMIGTQLKNVLWPAEAAVWSTLFWPWDLGGASTYYWKETQTHSKLTYLLLMDILYTHISQGMQLTIILKILWSEDCFLKCLFNLYRAEWKVTITMTYGAQVIKHFVLNSSQPNNIQFVLNISYDKQHIFTSDWLKKEHLKIIFHVLSVSHVQLRVLLINSYILIH